MIEEQERTALNKASGIAAVAAGYGDIALYLKISKACIEAIEWQREQDKLELDAKDESIIQMEMTIFERVQSVCRYKCAKIGDTYKCANEKSFGETCGKKNCPIIK